MRMLRASLPGALLLCGCSAIVGLSQYSEQASGDGPTLGGPDSGMARDGNDDTPEEPGLGSDDASEGACSNSLTACASGCTSIANDVNNCGTCGNSCTTAVTNAQAACADGGCGIGCNAGYTLCGGACVDFQTDKNNCGGCGATFACTSSLGCQSGSCASCTPVSLPPSVNVDVTQWVTKFAASPIWNCNASGTTTVDSNAGTVTSTSCSLGTVDVTNNVAQSVSGGPSVMVVRLQGLTVTSGHVLALKGDKPVVLLVAGDVVVDLGGRIDAGATGKSAGPGGSLSASCAGSTGTSESGMQWGGGGGGFGTAGGRGGKSSGSGAAAGTASTGANLQPLRGGCGGGTGGAGAGAAGAAGGAFEISASGTITIGTGSNPAILSAAGGGSPAVTTGQNVGSGGGGSGGGILLVSPVVASFGSGGVARVHGGASGGSEGCSCNPETSADNGQDGHSADNTAATGGRSADVNAAAGANGGLCAGAGCANASASGANGAAAQAPNSGSGGGGGGGRIQVIASSATAACD